MSTVFGSMSSITVSQLLAKSYATSKESLSATKDLLKLGAGFIKTNHLDQGVKSWAGVAQKLTGGAAIAEGALGGINSSRKISDTIANLPQEESALINGVQVVLNIAQFATAGLAFNGQASLLAASTLFLADKAIEVVENVALGRSAITDNGFMNRLLKYRYQDGVSKKGISKLLYSYSRLQHLDNKILKKLGKDYVDTSLYGSRVKRLEASKEWRNSGAGAV